MANASLTPIISNFEKLFSKLNERFYNNELQAPVITISPDTTKGAYGWCTGWRAWAEKSPKDLATMTPEEAKAAENSGYYEINPDFFSGPDNGPTAGANIFAAAGFLA